MKKMFSLILCIYAGMHLCQAQCDKKVLITSSKTEHLVGDSTVERSEDEKTTIEFDKSTFLVVPGNGDHQMSGTITSSTCNWSVPFKEGKTVLKVTFSTDEGRTMNVTITIEGKDGKISFLADLEQQQRKIRVIIDKFEEKTGG